MVVVDLIVPVPAGAPTVRAATRVQLHESHPALDHASRQQALLAERAGRVIVQAVEGLGGVALARDVRHFRSGCLHPERQFVRIHPRRELAVLGSFLHVPPVEPIQIFQQQPLLLGIGTGRSANVQYGRTVATEHRSLVHRGQVPRSVCRGARFDAAIEHDHERRQILVFRTESVNDPRA